MSTRDPGRLLYLIQGTPRLVLADALLEYRRFAREHPEDEMSQELLRVARDCRIALREKRRIMHATGEPGKANGRAVLSERARETREALQAARRSRLQRRWDTLGEGGS